MREQHPSGKGANAQILEEAAQWFVEFSDGEPEAAARRQFNFWVRRSPEHLQAYLELSAAWEDCGHLDQPGRPDAAALVELASKDPGMIVPLAAGRGIAAAAKPTATRRPRLWLAAAVLVLGLGALPAWQAMQGEVHATGIGEQRTLTLEDGSTVRLNALSELRVRFSEEERTLELLQGQALFDVRQDPRRPFVVRSHDARIRAVGTRFDVRRTGAATVVTVVQGRVAVQPLDARGDGREEILAPALLDAGEQIMVAPAGTGEPHAADVGAVTAWTEGRLVFEGTPLPEAVEAFNRFAARRIVLEDPRLAGFHVHGTFAAGDASDFLQFLQQRFDVSIERTRREIRVSRNISPAR